MKRRVWGRINNEWVEVNDDAGISITHLCQVLKLNLGESPFWANYGIPAHESVVASVYPFYYVQIVQSQFSNQFNSLAVEQRVIANNPVYDITGTTLNGSAFQTRIGV